MIIIYYFDRITSYGSYDFSRDNIQLFIVEQGAKEANVFLGGLRLPAVVLRVTYTPRGCSLLLPEANSILFERADF